jgi:hypothetical protein
VAAAELAVGYMWVTFLPTREGVAAAELAVLVDVGNSFFVIMDTRFH